MKCHQIREREGGEKMIWKKELINLLKSFSSEKRTSISEGLIVC